VLHAPTGRESHTGTSIGVAGKGISVKGSDSTLDIRGQPKFPDHLGETQSSVAGS